MNKLEGRLEAIEARNQRVELDKAWETSITRRFSIALLTYGVVVSYLFMIGNDNPPVNGLVPVVGYVLSTLAIRLIRNYWEKQQ